MLMLRPEQTCLSVISRFSKELVLNYETSSLCPILNGLF